MRKTGYILILIGLLWLGNWFARTSVPLPRSIFDEMDKKYPATRMYSRDEVLDAVSSVMTKFKDNAIKVFVPAALMLLGGILIDGGHRREMNSIRQHSTSDAN
jgi:hypothetical protein